jgi:hypothetical protein
MSLISGNVQFFGAVNCTVDVDEILGTAFFCDGAVNCGVTDNAIFCSSVNKGTVIGDYLIFNSSINSGVVSGCACFGYDSKNYGDIIGTGDFNETSTNFGDVDELVLCDQSFNSGNYTDLCFLIDSVTPTQRYNNSGKYLTYLYGDGSLAHGPYSTHYFESGDLSLCSTNPNEEIALDNSESYLYESGLPFTSICDQNIDYNGLIYGHCKSYSGIGGSLDLTNYLFNCCLCKKGDIVGYTRQENYEWIPNGNYDPIYDEYGVCIGQCAICDWTLVSITCTPNHIIGEYQVCLTNAPVLSDADLGISGAITTPIGTCLCSIPIRGNCCSCCFTYGRQETFLNNYCLYGLDNFDCRFCDQVSTAVRNCFCASGTLVACNYLLFPITDIGGLSMGRFDFAFNGCDPANLYKVNRACPSGYQISISNLSAGPYTVGTRAYSSNGVDDIYETNNYCSSGYTLGSSGNYLVIGTGTYSNGSGQAISDGTGYYYLINTYCSSGHAFTAGSNIYKNLEGTNRLIGSGIVKSNGIGSTFIDGSYVNSGVEVYGRDLNLSNSYPWGDTPKIGRFSYKSNGIGDVYSGSGFDYNSGDLIGNFLIRPVYIDTVPTWSDYFGCELRCNNFRHNPPGIGDLTTIYPSLFNFESRGTYGLGRTCLYFESSDPFNPNVVINEYASGCILSDMCPAQYFTYVKDVVLPTPYQTSSAQIIMLGGQSVCFNFFPGVDECIYNSNIDYCKVIFSGIKVPTIIECCSPIYACWINEETQESCCACIGYNINYTTGTPIPFSTGIKMGTVMPQYCSLTCKLHISNLCLDYPDQQIFFSNKECENMLSSCVGDFSCCGVCSCNCANYSGIITNRYFYNLDQISTDDTFDVKFCQTWECLPTISGTFADFCLDVRPQFNGFTPTGYCVNYINEAYVDCNYFDEWKNNPYNQCYIPGCKVGVCVTQLISLQPAVASCLRIGDINRYCCLTHSGEFGATGYEYIRLDLCTGVFDDINGCPYIFKAEFKALIEDDSEIRCVHVCIDDIAGCINGFNPIRSSENGWLCSDFDIISYNIYTSDNYLAIRSSSNLYSDYAAEEYFTLLKLGLTGPTVWNCANQYWAIRQTDQPLICCTVICCKE